MLRYDRYKPSGVEWLGEVPSHWGVKRLKWLADFVERGTAPTYSDDGVLVINQACLSSYKLNLNKAKYHQSKDDFRKFRGILKKDDVLIASTGRGVLGKCCLVDAEIEGFVDSHVSIIRDSKGRLPAKFLYYLLSTQYEMINACLAEGSTNQTELQRDSFRGLPIPVPPTLELARIVDFLDKKTAEIDTAVAKKQRLIELLQEQKSILINQAVTRGLNPDVPMRDSGVEWIGQIPAHWEILRAKYLFKEIDERSETGNEELLSVSHMTGVTPRSEKNINMFMAEDYSGSKLCQQNDLIFNIMWAWMGALGVSELAGIVSPAYGVYRQLKAGTFNNWFLEQLMRSSSYVAEYNRRSTGLHSSRLRLYANMFFDMEIAIPPKSEQDEIESKTKMHISQADAVIFATEREIEKLVELRSTLVASVVTGQVKV